MHTHLCSILAVLAVCAPLADSCCWAGTFYLAPGGDDAAGDGSRERPWRSIRHATDNVPDDGSMIVLRDGLYVGSQSVNRRFEQVCTVRAEHPYRARLRSPDGSARVFSCYGGRNVVLRGFEMFGSGGRGASTLFISVRRGPSGSR